MAIPFADIAFASNPKNNQRQPAEVFIRQREYNHDVAIITIDFESGGHKKYADGSAVRIAWGWLPNDIEVFLGYVQYSKTVTRPDGPKQLKLFCAGASRPFNQRRQRSYIRLGVNGIISRIAALHNFHIEQDASSRYHQHIPQLGQSDWALAVRLAKDIGFTFGARNTSLYFKRRQIDNRPGRQPLFRLISGLAVDGLKGAVIKVVHKAGSAPLAERSVIQIDGLDDNGNILTMVDTGDCCDPVKPVFTKFMPDDIPAPSLRSIQEGKELLAGLSGTNRFYVIANAKLSGDQRVRPGMTIALADVDEDTDGYWWVGAVDHTITPTSYTMDTEIGRETIVSTKYVPPPTSDSGKPEILPDEPGVEYVAEPEPLTDYNPLDDCIPIENIVTDPFGDTTSDVPDPLESPARQRMRGRRPRPSRPRGCCPGDDVPVVPVPRLNSWKAQW